MPLGLWTVVENRLLPGDYGRLSAFPRDLGTPPPLPGQFYMLRLGSGSDPLLRRPFSASLLSPRPGAAAGEPSWQLSFLYKVIGKGTTLLARLLPGQDLDCLGPLGRGFTLPGPAAPLPFRHPRPALLVAGGIGIAPFPLLAAELARRGTAARLYLGGRTARDLLGLEDLPLEGRDIVLATEDGSRGHRGLVAEPLAADLEGLPPGETAVYACGPNPMLAAVVELCRRRGVPVEISLEARMGCGLGVCLGCVVPRRPTAEEPGPRYWRVCQEGPVFRGEEVELDVFN